MRKILVLVVACCMLIGLWPGVCYAGEVEPVSLTLKRAVDLALVNNKDLKRASLDVDAAKISRDEAWDAYNVALLQTYIPGTDLHVSVPTGKDPEGSVYLTNFDWLSKQKTYAAKAESVITTVYQKYFAVLSALQKVEAQRLASQRDAQRLKCAEAYYQAGMQTTLGLSGARTLAASSQAALTTAMEEYNQAYSDLMEYIGLPTTTQAILTDTVTYLPLQIENVDAEINIIADNSPAVWIAAEAVRLEEQTYGMLHSYDLDKVKLNSANVSVDITREQMRQAARGFYYKAKSIENSYFSAKEAVDNAAETLHITKLMYQLGLKTSADVLQDEAAFANAQKTLDDLVYQHQIFKMAFYKPWTYTVPSGSSAGLMSGSGH